MERIIEALKFLPTFWKNWWEMNFTGDHAILNIYLVTMIVVIILIIMLVKILKKKKRNRGNK